MSQKNRKQKAELSTYLEIRYQQLTDILKKLYAQLENEGFSAGLYTKINVAEHSLMVCEKRMAGTTSDPRFELEYSVPKFAS